MRRKSKPPGSDGPGGGRQMRGQDHHRSRLGQVARLGHRAARPAPACGVRVGRHVVQHHPVKREPQGIGLRRSISTIRPSTGAVVAKLQHRGRDRYAPEARRQAARPEGRRQRPPAGRASSDPKARSRTAATTSRSRATRRRPRPAPTAAQTKARSPMPISTGDPGKQRSRAPLASGVQGAALGHRTLPPHPRLPRQAPSLLPTWFPKG